MTEVLKNADRQYSLWAEVEIAFDDGLDVAQAASVQDLLDIPGGAVVVGGEIVVTEAWNAGTSAVVDIGDGDDPDRYTSSPVNLQAAVNLNLISPLLKRLVCMVQGI